MINVIIDVSRYVMILLMMSYTWWNFRYFAIKEERRKRNVCRLQNMVMFVLHLLAYGILYLQTGDERIVLFYVAQAVFFLCYIWLYGMFYRNVSRLLVNNTCMLITVGLIILSRLSFERAIRQFGIIALAALLTWIIPFIIDRVWQLSRIPWVYGIIGLILLLVVLVAGNTSFGAQLSLNIGGFAFQPSEFVKISFVFFVATMFYRSTDVKTVAVTTAAAAVHVLILVVSKDLGGAFIFFIVYLLMLFVATTNWFYLLCGSVGGSVAGFLAYQLFPHVQTRFQAWSNPWADIDNRGYQITQSLFAIGTGGWFGLGLHQGMPKKIPVVEKDFIFAAISEELGGIFALCVVLICLGCFLQFMLVASSMQAIFYKLIAFGLGIVYLTQVFLTVGGVIKFIPSTGVTLPFVSYGGSSVLSTFIIFSIIQGMYILKRNEEEEYEEEYTESKSE